MSPTTLRVRTDAPRLIASLQVYGVVERIVGRSLAWRLGRWLYQGARRELVNDPHVNGEYALQAWVVDAINRNRGDARPAFVDVGANVGAWTKRLVETLASGGIEDFRIYAFEPADAQRGRIEAGLASAIAAGRVSIDSRGVCEQVGRAPFLVTGSESGTSSIQPQRNGPGLTTIETVTLDALTAETSVNEFVLVKVDTEGNDFNVICGARVLLGEGRIGILQFEYNWRWINFGHRMYDVFGLAAEVGYHLGRLTPDGVEIYDRWHFELDRYIECNFLLVRDDWLRHLAHVRARWDVSNVAAPGPSEWRRPLSDT